MCWLRICPGAAGCCHRSRRPLLSHHPLGRSVQDMPLDPPEPDARLSLQPPRLLTAAEGHRRNAHAARAAAALFSTSTRAIAIPSAGCRRLWHDDLRLRPQPLSGLVPALGTLRRSAADAQARREHAREWTSSLVLAAATRCRGYSSTARHASAGCLFLPRHHSRRRLHGRSKLHIGAPSSLIHIGAPSAVH